MRIGISDFIHEGQSTGESGVAQNAVFLAQLLRRLPFVRSVTLLDVGTQTEAVSPEQVYVNALGLRRMLARDAAHEVDVIIEMAGVLDPQWLALQRTRGKKVVYYCSAGQPYAGLIEPAVFDRPSTFLPPGLCDEIWVPPQYLTFAGVLRVLHRCPIQVVPYLWHPQFLDLRVAEVEKLGHRFGWQGGAPLNGLRVAIFEPNVSVARTSSISMLACDEAYRADRGSIAMMNVLNTLHLKDHPTMRYLANSLDLVKQHRALFLGHHDFVGFMAGHADAVVSHQWFNDQNSSDLGALYGDYPLVHNSPWLNGFGAGYYYDGFDAAEGGRRLIEAGVFHNAQLASYRARSQTVFDAVNPFAEANLHAYALLLQELCRDAPELVVA